MRSVFGWDLPPGCSQRDIDEAAGVNAMCAVCANYLDDCVCPECQECGEIGDPDCYKKHGMKLNKEQLLARSKRRIADLQDQITDEGMYQAWLEDQPDDFMDNLT